MSVLSLQRPASPSSLKVRPLRHAVSNQCLEIRLLSSKQNKTKRNSRCTTRRQDSCQGSIFSFILRQRETRPLWPAPCIFFSLSFSPYIKDSQFLFTTVLPGDSEMCLASQNHRCMVLSRATSLRAKHVKFRFLGTPRSQESPSGGSALADRALCSEALSWARKAHADAQLSLFCISAAGRRLDKTGPRLSLGKLSPLSTGVVVCVRIYFFSPSGRI